MPEEGIKQCGGCGKYLPHTRFGTRKHTLKDGTVTKYLRHKCRDCTSQDNLKRFHFNPATKEAHKRASYKHRIKSYGLTTEEYEALWEKSGGCCYICGEHQSKLQNLHIDHCHSTGVVRGLLCTRCNSGLGMFRDDPDKLKAALKYLEDPLANICSRL